MTTKNLAVKQVLKETEIDGFTVEVPLFEATVGDKIQLFASRKDAYTWVKSQKSASKRLPKAARTLLRAYNLIATLSDEDLGNLPEKALDAFETMLDSMVETMKLVGVQVEDE